MNSKLFILLFLPLMLFAQSDTLNLLKTLIENSEFKEAQGNRVIDRGQLGYVKAVQQRDIAIANKQFYRLEIKKILEHHNVAVASDSITSNAKKNNPQASTTAITSTELPLSSTLNTLSMETIDRKIRTGRALAIAGGIVSLTGIVFMIQGKRIAEDSDNLTEFLLFDGPIGFAAFSFGALQLTAGGTLAIIGGAKISKYNNYKLYKTSQPTVSLNFSIDF